LSLRLKLAKLSADQVFMNFTLDCM